MKILKRTLRILALLLLAVIILLAVAPFLFKDKIREIVHTELNNSLNAEVFFGDVGLSFFSNFPNASISLQDFGVVNQAPFEGGHPRQRTGLRAGGRHCQRHLRR